MALWALILALTTVLVGAASARGGSGGTGTANGGGEAQECTTSQFGARTLERGDCGNDVVTLNWILKAKDYAVPLERRFRRPTHTSVREFQRRKGLRDDGVVDRSTRAALAAGMKRRLSSWYGPGFWGNYTACGQRLRKRTVGVAHRSLPCGTRVVFKYGGRYLRTRVIDRGPYVKRRYERDWDLTRAAARRLRFEGTDHVRSAVIR